MKTTIENEGYVIYKGFFHPDSISNIKKEAEMIFMNQFIHLGYVNVDKGPLTPFGFKENMVRLFNEQEEIFKNCGKLIQTGLISLYNIALDHYLLNSIKHCGGIKSPNMCTRPVLFFNHPQLAKSEEYYKTPKHQDWPSMEASQNSLVVWVPLVDVNKENGSIIIYPGSHKQGILPYKTTGGFAEVEYEGESIQPEMKVGDIAIFSTKLVHKSGDILDDSIRWSCHFRYTDMLEDDFIGRGYPSPYVYKPVTKM